MESINDIANENTKSFSNDNARKLLIQPEHREHAQNEDLADRLRAKLKGVDREPFLAVAYSGIPISIIERHLAKATEVGREPIKLFMYLVSREPLWHDYQQKKAASKNET